jgi:regulator of cell morphogenesis and NO signaling
MSKENINQRTVTSLVLKNYQIVTILKKYNIDFCCGGKSNLADACIEKGVDLSMVLSEIEAVIRSDTNKTLPFV